MHYLFETIYRSGYYGEDWVPKIWVPKGNTQPEPNFGYGLGLCLNSMEFFGLGTQRRL